MKRRGRFITFEGLEGTGKSTHCALVAARLREAGLKVIETREPGGTSLGETLRDLLQRASFEEDIAPEAELLLFGAGRAQLVRSVIRPALAGGVWVLCDRFLDSTTAYQGYGRGMPLADVESVHGVSVGSTMPDMTILLDLPVRTGLARMRRRNAGRGQEPDRFEREEIAFHERVRRGYRELARKHGRRFVMISAAGPVEEVAEQVWAAVWRRFRGEIGRRG